MAGVDGIYGGQNVTENGTRIVKSSQEMDKNAFFKILAAELRNQDPTNAKDGTEFISQMAQFSSLEQMANLNNTMSFNAASSLIGGKVKLNNYDMDGLPYEGIVTGVKKQGSSMKVEVRVIKENIKNGAVSYENKEFDYKDVVHATGASPKDIITDEDLATSILLIGELVEFKIEKDGEQVYGRGFVKSVTKDSEGIKLTVDIGDKKEELINIKYEELIGNSDDNTDNGDTSDNENTES
ncbi:flagellar hook capping protein [Clostridium aestuarii]|uniref:Basal-body rod modification protein FlgD n=1 Tax=Clostridium aestuarii TaxID=338193 RepID=A0ABT4CXG9_9CLOT|nr:flagellar hook capping FlgD N-terminal domain-containing protein [Clostridium aestuarii]MCY6483686.1 flagellar hook capping protein [Clostridium aestuarii]